MYAEDDLLPIAGLQHFLFCERQWGLIHLEQQWAENRLTAEGAVLHENADSDTEEWRDGILICRGLRIRSLRLGLIGRADVVEFHPHPDGGRRPFPVEYKRGRPKGEDMDRVQLCAQALCLEEMLQRPIPCGALFYGEPRRREDVAFDAALRDLTETTVGRMRQCYEEGRTPPAVFAKRCESCSLIELCLPRLRTKQPSAAGWLARAVRENLREG